MTADPDHADDPDPDEPGRPGRRDGDPELETSLTPEAVDPSAVELGGPEAVGTVATPPPSGLRHAVRAFRHRDYAIFWTGALFSNTGSWVQNLTVPFVLYEITESATWVGAATFAQFIPAMALGPLAGSIADRYDRRRILMVTQSLMALAALTLWASWALGLRNVWGILGLVALSGVVAGINIPSWQAFVNDMVPREDLLSAVTLNSLQFNAARAFGPAIAGILLYSFGPTWAFLVNGLSFVFVLVALLLVRTRPHRRASPLSGSFINQFARAVRYTRTQPGILVGMMSAVLVGFLGNPIQQFTVILAKDEFEVDELGLGMLNVALGLGAVLAAPIISGWDHVLTRSTIVRIALPMYGAAVITVGVAPNFAVALGALVVVGAGFLSVIATTNTAVQVIVADHVRGRVMAFRIMAFTGAYPIGALVQGAIADRIGTRATVAGAGTILVVVGLYLGTMRRSLLDRLDDPHDETIGAGFATPVQGG